MFPPSLQSVFASATHARHYETIITGDSVRVIANGREDHTLALEMVEHLGRLNRLPACASSATDSCSKQQPPPMSSATSVQVGTEVIPMESIAQTSSVSLPTAASSTQAMCVAPAGTAPLLSKRAEIYQAGLQTKGAASSTKGEARFVLDLLVELIGDKPVNEVDADDILKFQRAIAFWPVNIGRRKDFKEMKKLDVIKRGKAELTLPLDFASHNRCRGQACFAC